MSASKDIEIEVVEGKKVAMLNLHPNVLKKDGKPEFVVLSYDEYSTLKDYVEDMEDLLDLRKAKKKDAGKPTLSLSEVKKGLGI